MRVRVLVASACVFLAAAVVCASPAFAGTIFVFTPTNPKPGSKLAFLGAIKAPPPDDGTNAGYDGAQVPEDATEADMYLAPNADVPSLTGQDDPRLIPIGHYDWSGSSRTCCPTDTHFKIPLKGLDPGVYAAAAWCEKCAHKGLHAIGVGDLDGSPAPQMLLRIQSEGFSHWLLTVAVGCGLIAALGAALAVRHARQPKPQL